VAAFVLSDVVRAADNDGVDPQDRGAWMRPTTGIGLEVNSGIPVVVVCGEWAAGTAAALADLIGDLADAGHYEIVLNVQRVAVAGAGVVGLLRALADSMRAHHGHLDIVGTAEQVRTMLDQAGQERFRLSTSEARAISRIKRWPVYAADQRTTARLRIARGPGEPIAPGGDRH
jgi:anti-anti-sigma factor